ncbi:MAG: tol-pal system protein YbgF [Pseudomonadota bacterium]
MRLSIAAALLAVSVGAGPALAQGGWVNPDAFAQMQRELERLSAEIEIMRGAGASASGGPAPSGDLFLRLQRLEQTVRDLTGQVEVLQQAARQADQRERAKIEEFEFRLSRLEGDDPPPPAPSQSFGETPGDGAPAPATGPLASVAGASGATAGGFQGGRLPPLDPVNRAPAGAALGTIPGSQASAPISTPIYDNPRGQSVAAAPSPQGAPAPSVAETVRYEDAVTSLQDGDHDRAEQQLQAFIGQNPNDPRVSEATYWLGETYRVRGRFREAAQTYAAGLRKEPNSKRAPDSWMRLGMSLAQLNQSQKACEAFAQVEARFPDAPSSVLRQTKTQALRAGCS